MEGTLFRYGPAAANVAFLSGRHPRYVVLVGGLTDGLLFAPYVRPLAARLEERRWSLVQVLLSSSHTGYGCASLDQDAEELHRLACHLRAEYGSQGMVIVGHSTGCQDAVRYAQQYCSAPSSDSSNGSQAGSAQQQAGGDDDMFSCSLSDAQLAAIYGPLAGLPTLLLLSGADQYVPPEVDYPAVGRRLAQAIGASAQLRILFLEARDDMVRDIDHRGRTALQWACRCGQVEAARVLLQAEPKLATWQDMDCGFTPMVEGAKRGHLPLMRLLFEHAPASATEPAHGSISPLCFAAAANQAEAVRLLLEAAPEAAAARTHDGSTALHWAASAGATAAAQALLEGAPELALATNNAGQTPLSTAAASGATAVAGLLLGAAPAAALLTDAEGSTPLMVAVKEKHPALVQQLLAAAPEAAAVTDKQGNTALHWGAASENKAIVSALLAAAPETATAVNEAGAPVHIAAYNASLPIVELLVAAAPQAMAAQDVKGKTALEVALTNAYGRTAVVRCLLRAAGHPPAVLLGMLRALPKWKAPSVEPVYADVVASGRLRNGQWGIVPKTCQGLGRALPAVVERSTHEAALLVRHLLPADRERLRTWALTLVRLQRRLGINLPAELCGRLAALFDAAD
ncbi:UPF0613 -like [Chlorella sorokiniana]|uniref:UPF0613-like n=1 Tax=Chlorella sorokiniana TaxID=3076 RepID=A0A2P6TPT5_CHLSO|nr:UPF0613 -like [Chlorella sorokiniana]|eukprot:PRW56053.1 UPF0613 -like [Chlorella sorokiniana]